MRESDWLDICGHISAMWPNDPIPPATAVAWLPLLADLGADQVRQAIHELRLDPAVRWAPTPGQIRDACTPAVAAWTEAIETVYRLLSGGCTPDPSGAVGAYVASIAPTSSARRALKWDPSDPTTRAQFRDWWADYHRRLARMDRRVVAQHAIGTSRPQLEAM